MNIPSPHLAADRARQGTRIRFDEGRPSADAGLQGVVASLASILDFGRTPVIIQVAGVTEEEAAGDVAWNLSCSMHDSLLGRCCLLELLDDNRGMLLPAGDAAALQLSAAEFGGLIQGRLRSFAENCTNAFDVIVVSSGPILTSAQASLTARQADGVILIVASERTRIADAQLARSMLEKAEANLLGIVVTERRHRLERWLRPLRRLFGS